MLGLMNQVSDIYNKRLLDYADRQEIFGCKLYVSRQKCHLFLDCPIRINGQYTLDNIASCLFGIETNSLQNENATLINHLKKFFTISFSNIFLVVVRKSLTRPSKTPHYVCSSTRSDFAAIGRLLGEERLFSLADRCGGLH